MSSKLNDLLSSMLVMCVCGGNLRRADENYERHGYYPLPRIYCKDGFNISIQINNGNYCASENGSRTFGLDWQMVEWGFPSEELTDEKYKTDGDIGAYVPIEVMDELLESHGGIDYETTFKYAYEHNKKAYDKVHSMPPTF